MACSLLSLRVLITYEQVGERMIPALDDLTDVMDFLCSVPFLGYVKSQSPSPLQIIQNRDTLFLGSFFLFRNCTLASGIDLESLGAG